MKSTVFLIFSLAVVVASATNYCTKCQNHIGCNNNGQFKTTCPRDAFMVQMSESAKQALLNAHNTVRNKIAGGGQPGFNQASQMMRVKWDNELAYLAELNVKKCKMEHDGCIQTDAYPVAGQNLYWAGATNHDSDVNKVLSNAVYAWYNEYKDANQNDINNCCGGSKFMKIGHFTQVVRDKTVAIGCAASRYTQNGWKATLVACNYSYGNMMGTPVYHSGNPASKCPNGRDSTFGNLCRS